MKLRLLQYFLIVILGGVIFVGGYVLGQSKYAPVHLTGPIAETPAEAKDAFAPFWETWQLIQS